LPVPNEDIVLGEPIPLSATAIGELLWHDEEYLPIAKVNDGDLLVVNLINPAHSIHAYFHDGGEYDLLYDSLRSGINELSK